MRAPNQAELILPPIPDTEIAHNQVVAPNAINTPQIERRGSIKIASTLLVTTALAGLAPAASASAEHHESETVRATTAATSTYAANNMRSVAYERPNNIYSGSVTIQAPRSARTTRKLQEPSTIESDGVLIAQQMGLSTNQVAQGKKTEVTISDVRIDLADYRSGTRTAEAWNKSKDCAWNWAKQDIAVAGKAAGLAEEKIKQTANNPQNIQRVMQGYFEDNANLRNDSRHFLNTGTAYVAKHARAEADELVGAMRAAKQEPATKPNPDTQTQTQPDYKPKHAAPEAAPAPTTWERFKKVAAPVMRLGGLALGGVVLVGAAIAGFGRLRRRRRDDGVAMPIGKHHHSPNPDGGASLPPDDFSDLREITEKDKGNDHDPIDPPTGAHAIGGLGRSPFAPPPSENAPTESKSETSSPTDIRARFGRPKLLETPITQRHLRPVPSTSPSSEAAESIRRAFGSAETTPESNLVDSPTDPEAGKVFPLRRPPTQGRGKLPNGDYIGVHRRAEPVVSRVPVHRPAFASVASATDIRVAAV